MMALATQNQFTVHSQPFFEVLTESGVIVKDDGILLSTEDWLTDYVRYDAARILCIIYTRILRHLLDSNKRNLENSMYNHVKFSQEYGYEVLTLVNAFEEFVLNPIIYQKESRGRTDHVHGVNTGLLETLFTTISTL